MDPTQTVAPLTEIVMGLTQRQRDAIDDNGWATLSDFRGYTHTEIKDWTERIDKRPANRGGCSFGTVASQKLQSLNFWINQEILRGHALHNGGFTDAVMRAAMEEYKIAVLEDKSKTDATLPKTFAYEDWIDWQQSVVTYLKAKKSITPAIPLYYVVRDDPCPIDPAAMTSTDEIVYNASHNGRAYLTDNREVHRILDELTLGTDAADWIKTHRRRHDGRAAWIALCDHYDGPAEGDKRVTVARANLDTAFYKNEATFSFEKYSTRLKKAFDTLRQYKQPKSDREEVEILLKGINTNNVQLSSCIAICRATHADDFNMAVTYLSTQVAQIFPQSQPGSNTRNRGRTDNGRRRNVSSVVKKKGKVTCNNVDISDTTRYFTKKEWDKLSPQGIQYLNDCPKRKAMKETLKKKKHAKVSATSTAGTPAAGDDMDDRTRALTSAIINGVMTANAANAQVNQGDDSSLFTPSVPGRVQMPQHGSHARQTSATSTRTNRTRRYNEYGQIIPE